VKAFRFYSAGKGAVGRSKALSAQRADTKFARYHLLSGAIKILIAGISVSNDLPCPLTSVLKLKINVVYFQ
jgi:hypothetical protein